jgi:hypothetical protein
VKAHLLVISLVASFWASFAAAQDGLSLSPADMRGLSARLIDAGRLAEAAALTDALIARDPTDATALILRARVALATGDAGGAITLASRAFRAAEGDDQRYAAARIAARGHAALKQDTRAQWWLRRAGNVAPDTAAERSVAEEFRAIRQRNPLAISLQFGISPSSNINGGSDNSTSGSINDELPFINYGAALPLSGLQFEAGVRLSYRLNQTDRSGTFFDFGLSGRTYALSEDAKRIIREDPNETPPYTRGSDFADLVASIGLSHRWLPENARGPWSVTGTLGQTWYDGSPYVSFSQIALSKTSRYEGGRRLDLSGFIETQDRPYEEPVELEQPPLVEPPPDPGKPPETDTIQREGRLIALGGSARWSWTRPDRDEVSVTAGFRDTLNDIEALTDVAYDSLSVGAAYQFAEPFLSVKLGLGADLEYRYFARSKLLEDDLFTGMGPRDDWRGNLRLVVGLPELSYYGFEPQIIFRASRTESTAPRIDSRSLAVDFGIVSSF